MILPYVHEDVDPVEDDIGDLRGDPDELHEVSRVRNLRIGVVLAQFVIHEVLGKSNGEYFFL